MYKKLAGVLLCLTACTAVHAASLQQSLEVENNTSAAGRKSQQQVNKLDNETSELLREYQRLMQQGDYQKAYNEELERRLEDQKQELEQLQQQIADVQITRLHVMPLLRDMVAGLAQFIELDLPFERKARLQSVKKLETLLASGTVPLAEKFRRVMEAWQAESDYSYQLGTYRDTVELDDETVTVEFLRIGRMALYFQTLDGKRSGYWNRQDKKWQMLDGEYNQPIRRGLRIADKQLPPELLTVPVDSREVQP